MIVLEGFVAIIVGLLLPHTEPTKEDAPEKVENTEQVSTIHEETVESVTSCQTCTIVVVCTVDTARSSVFIYIVIFIVLVMEITDRKRDVEVRAMEIVMAYEKENGRNPINVSDADRGWDIESKNQDGKVERYIEVKGHAGRGSTYVSQNEWIQAENHSNAYWLYVVFYVRGQRVKLHRKQNPFKNTAPESRTQYIISPEDMEGR